MNRTVAPSPSNSTAASTCGTPTPSSDAMRWLILSTLPPTYAGGSNRHAAWTPSRPLWQPYPGARAEHPAERVEEGKPGYLTYAAKMREKPGQDCHFSLSGEPDRRGAL